jgi:hypothetical protein
MLIKKNKKFGRSDHTEHIYATSQLFTGLL